MKVLISLICIVVFVVFLTIHRFNSFKITIINNTGSEKSLVISCPMWADSYTKFIYTGVKPGQQKVVYYPLDKLNDHLKVCDMEKKCMYLERTCRGFGGCSMSENSAVARLSNLKKN